MKTAMNPSDAKKIVEVYLDTIKLHSQSCVGPLLESECHVEYVDANGYPRTISIVVRDRAVDMP